MSSIEQALHDRWPTLAVSSLVPAARFTTGYTGEATASPFVSVMRTSQERKRTSGNQVELWSTMAFAIHGPNFDECQAVSEALQRDWPNGLDRAGASHSVPFEFGTLRIFDAEIVDESYAQNEDFAWTFSLLIRFHTRQPRG
jgi:hypothetical protein